MEVEEPSPRAFSPERKARRPMRVVRKDDTPRRKVASDGIKLGHFVVWIVIAVVKKEIHRALKSLQVRDGVADQLSSHSCIVSGDQIPGRRIGIQHDQSTDSITKERSGEHARSEAFVCTGFHDQCGSQRPSQCIPADSPSISNIAISYASQRRSCCVPMDVVPQCCIIKHLRRPTSAVCNRRLGDRGYEPRQMFKVVRLKVVCEVLGLTRRDEPPRGYSKSACLDLPYGSNASRQRRQPAQPASLQEFSEISVHVCHGSSGQGRL